MIRDFRRATGTLLLAAVATAAAGGGLSAQGVIITPPGTSIANLKPLPISEADVHFMTGMIPHHAQAVKIASWAASHGARNDVRILAERIVVAQRDEIKLMQLWLKDNGKPVPDSNATHHRMRMGDTVHDMLMPGMLTDTELAQLDSARGSRFDRLFLTFMIKHHEGAITMVDELFDSPGAAQDEIVFRFASDVYADQTTEIERMWLMLETVPPQPSRSPSR